VTVPVDTVPPPPPEHRLPNRLYQAAAWVAIVAGTVFIVGAVLYAGFILGRHSGYGGPGTGGWRDRDNAQFHQRMAPPLMPMGPGIGQGGPGMGPGTGPGMTPPAQTTTSAPRP